MRVLLSFLIITCLKPKSHPDSCCNYVLSSLYLINIRKYVLRCAFEELGFDERLDFPIQDVVSAHRMEFLDEIEFEFYGDPRGELERDILVGERAAVPPRL